MRTARVTRSIFLRATIAGSVAMLAGCSTQSQQAAPTTAPAAAGAATSAAAPTSVPAVAPTAAAGAPTIAVGTQTGGSLRVGIDSNPISLDPSPSNGDLFVVHAIYDTLFNFDAQLNTKPGLVESWETPNDTTMLLHLRKGVKFHDGTDFDAEAIKLNIEHTQDPASRSLFAADLAGIVSVDVVDSVTARFNLKGVQAPLLASLGMQPGHMIAPSALKQYGKDAGRHPVGTGPYMFKEWVEQDHITLERNPNYWNPSDVRLDEIVYRIVPDPTVRLTNLKAGQLDYVVTIPFKEVASMRTNQDYQLFRTWAGAERFILNCSKPPFDQKPLRQALQYAIDRAGLDRAVFFNTGVIGYGPVHPPGGWAFDPNWKPITLDLVKARSLLKDGGAPDGFAFSIIASDPIYQQIAVAYQGMFEPLGIKVTVVQEDSAKRVADQLAQNYQASLSTWQTTLDPSPALYGPYRTGGSSNYLKYSNPNLDALLDQQLTSYDHNFRRPLLRQIDQILADDAPCPIPYHRARFDAATPKVQGITPGADPQLELRGVSLNT